MHCIRGIYHLNFHLIRGFYPTFIGPDQIALPLQAVAPFVHQLKATRSHEVFLAVGVSDLEGVLVGAVVRQRDLEKGPEFNGASLLLLLPSLVHILVVVQD